MSEENADPGGKREIPPRGTPPQKQIGHDAVSCVNTIWGSMTVIALLTIFVEPLCHMLSIHCTTLAICKPDFSTQSSEMDQISFDREAT